MAQFDFESFRLQQTTFAVLNLFVLAALLVLHTLFSQVLGNPSPILLVSLGTAFLIKLLELLWVQTRSAALSRVAAVVLNWVSITVNLALALLLTFLTNKEESPYFVLLALPVLQAAYHLGLSALISVVAIADSMMFFWVWHFAAFHPPVHAGEYLETGVISLVYTLVGLLVWSLVNRIRRDQERLTENMNELERTRKKLADEEKLAAVGRLSSAIAHEIRNPVAMIASSMATAESAGITTEAREEMYAIATAEASRLEKLTSDFLTYARPGTPDRAPARISELLGYIAEIAKPHALRKGVSVVAEARDELCGNLDSGQVQRALLNLVMNAIDAAECGSEVRMRAARFVQGEVQIEVENVGQAIREEVLANVFEPFYTTKPQGTGLGLAIARNIARAHGGDIVVACNEPKKVCFTIFLKDDAETGGSPDGPNPDRR
jgi:two-component system sensor histidine kinase HydH